MVEEQLVDTWQIHNRIMVYVLDAVAPAAIGSRLAGKGRSVGEQFAHLHNVRLMWLRSAAPELLTGLTKIEKAEAIDKEHLHAALTASGEAIAALLRQVLATGGKIKGFKPHASAFLGYLVAHESYHQGEIGLILGQAGLPLDKKVAYGMWEWGVR